MESAPDTKRLRILIACPPVRNPFILQLIESLYLNAEVESVQHGLLWLKSPQATFDIVHIHWPEALNDWREPTSRDLFQIEQSIKRWRSDGAAIVTTIHNEKPHRGEGSSGFDQLYEMIYSNTTAFIHFGKASIAKVFKGCENESKHFVIPHGNYDYFRRIADLTAPVSVACKRNQFRVLALGQVRHQAEIDLLVAAGKHLERIGGILIIAGKLGRLARKKLRRYASKLFFWRSANIQLIEHFIPDEHIQSLIESAHVVLIPRVKSLNSGNVALGFTFGKIVVGPSVGVIGEELQRQSNPVFDPNDPGTLGQAFDAAKQAINEQRGGRNLAYANDVLNWQRIANEHCSVYRWAEQHASKIF